MFFPFLRGKLYELLTLRDLAPRIVREGGIMPIIEPVRDNASSRLSFQLYTECNLRFILVVNPSVGNLQGSVFERLIEPILGEYRNYIPALRVDGKTRVAQIRAFRTQFANSHPELAFIFTGEPTTAAVLEELNACPHMRYYIFDEYCTSAELRSLFPQQNVIVINDCFAKEARNADYPENAFFTDKHLPGRGPVAGSGNYSIVGSDYSEGGGPALAVALHHVYFRRGHNSALHVRHFVSDRTETAVDPGGKFLEALTKLVQELPLLGQANHTPTCDEYNQLYADQHFPGLGYAKKLALKHHIELMIGR